MRNLEFLDQPGHAPIQDRHSFETTLDTEGAGEPRLPATGRSGNQQWLSPLHPLAGNERLHLALVQSTGRGVVDVGHASVTDKTNTILIKSLPSIVRNQNMGVSQGMKSSNFLAIKHYCPGKTCHGSLGSFSLTNRCMNSTKIDAAGVNERLARV